MVTFRSVAGTPNERAIRWVAVTTIVPSRFSMKKALATTVPGRAKAGPA